MHISKKPKLLLIYLSLALTLVACGGSGGGTTQPSITFSSYELLDPTPGAGDQFGQKIIILPNGNIVVSDPGDSSIATNNGAVHLFNPVTQELIASIYGDNAEDRLGSDSGIYALPNNNFVIASPVDNENGVIDAGTVKLINGETGIQIGSTISGETENDRIGGGIIVLTNNNFVISSRFDNENGLTRAGSVKLINGSTGVQIGNTLTGENNYDLLGSYGVVALTNNNFVIRSPNAEVNNISEAGSVILVNGTTGVQIGSTFSGDNVKDKFGGDDVVELTNNNFVISSGSDDVNGVFDAGSVILVNGTTGIQIGSPITGDNDIDRLGSTSITALANNNFVISSRFDDVNGIVDAGSVILVNGSTGSQINNTLSGENTGDRFGSRITALANNNFVIGSPESNQNSLNNAGSIMLMNGSSGSQIGSTIVGDSANDFLGGTVEALINNNYVIAQRNVTDIISAGSVRLIDGTTNIQVTNTLEGDNPEDQLDNITTLSNGNFFVHSVIDDVNGVVDAGSIRLMSGTTNTQIGNTISGQSENDQIGNHNDSFVLANNRVAFFSETEDFNGIVDAGSVRLIDGSNGAIVGNIIYGETTGDTDNAFITGNTNGDYAIIGLQYADKDGLVDSGKVRLIAY